ncbi:MAG TPA: shikimate dehydrogenase [Chitinophagaceae bacterium]|nr:shikimate dehydrogenase [Chitinophagaceae bacterium]HMZ46149.1 shikimate dehydrogenase [Chitinophagaceae bacterium]HNF30165.1 shikimate dehydrogenase [Chitinophagaceae bacterium]HNJ58151.1 shikimate dehydrogenase [Chitinophagaceae bacterium]HNL83124.1 shikimate dehydrogenase [Chitinophagaceae bacterium]
MKIFGLVGNSLSHSMSKKYFEDKFLKENLPDYYFKNFELTDINQLKELLATTKNLCGLAVTIPYKQAVLPFLNFATKEVETISACNCIKITDNVLYGFNTDIIGFEKSFTSLLQPQHQKALILGNGGAAKAVKYVLQKLAIPYLIVSRNKEKQYPSISYQEINEQIVEEYKIIINTTPLGTFPAINNCANIPYNLLNKTNYLYDLVYNPAVTKFLELGKQQGALIKNGSDMLIIQAEENWKIWNQN